MWTGKIYLVILSVTCHSLRNFPSLIHIPHIHLWIFKTLWVIISWVWVIPKMLKVNCTEIHWIILSVTCHLDVTPLHPCMTHPIPTWSTYPAWPTPTLHDPPTPAWPTPPLHTHPTSTWPTHPCPYITHPTPTWPTLPLHNPPHPYMTHHSLRNFPQFIHIPSYPFMNFQNPKSCISWVLVICKRLNVNWKKIHSILLFVICHSLRNYPPLIHIPCIHS